MSGGSTGQLQIPVAGYSSACRCDDGGSVVQLREREKDTEGMSKVGLLAPYVTRIALSLFFAVSYLQAVGHDPTAHRCLGKGKPKLMACKKVRYCSKACSYLPPFIIPCHSCHFVALSRGVNRETGKPANRGENIPSVPTAPRLR